MIAEIEDSPYASAYTAPDGSKAEYRTFAEWQAGKLSSGNISLVNYASGSYNNIAYSEYNEARNSFETLTQVRIDKLTIAVKKKGAIILPQSEEIDERLNKLGASASTVHDAIMIRTDVKMNELLEEIRHVEQNLIGLNNEHPHDLREILSEIEAREYILQNSSQVQLPRKEIEYVRNGLSAYQERLKTWRENHNEYNI